MKILHFADLHLGVETYGRTNPETGLSTRLEDFLQAFDQVVDYALGNNIDLVLFCGDAYKTREPSQTQQREFAKRINRLAIGGVPVFLLTGNHDLPNGIGRATALEIFDTLTIQNVYVANKPQVFRIPTPSGVLQVISLPWLRRSALLSREDSKNLNFEQINQRLQQVLTDIVSSKVKELDPKLPAILAAHVWVQGAKVGSEKSMTIGQEHVLLLGNVRNSALDYVALGHIHKGQVLADNPPVVYSGSLSRVDFGEEADEKGFYLIDIAEDSAGKKTVTYAFHPVTSRRFVTIDVNVAAEDPDPHSTIVKAIQSGAENRVKDAIVRLQINLPAGMESQLREADIKEALKDAYHCTVARDVRREARVRLGDRSTEEITPLDALKAYLESRTKSPEDTKTFLEYGERLIESGET